MAYLRRIPNSPFWIAGFDLPDGRRTQRSTKTKDRKLAMRLAEQFEEAAKNHATEEQARKVLSDIVKQVHGSGLTVRTVRQHAEEWLLAKSAAVQAGGSSGETLRCYKSTAKAFVEALGAKADLPLHHLSVQDVSSWYSAVVERTSLRTGANQLKIVRTMLQSAMRSRLLEINVASLVQVMKVGKAIRKEFSLAELKAILSVADDEWKGLILAGLYTGQRLKDLASMTWAQVDLQGPEVRMRTSKTDREIHLPIAGPLLGWLEKTASISDDPTAPVFPSLFPLAMKVGGTAQLSQRFHGILVAAGLAKKRLPKAESKGVGRSAPRERNPLTFHSLRHTATSLLKNGGVAEAVTRDIIGHDSEQVSRLYTHISIDSKRKALSAIPDVTR